MALLLVLQIPFKPKNEFVAIQWTDLDFVLQSVQTIFNSYDIKAVKMGIAPSLEYLREIIITVKSWP